MTEETIVYGLNAGEVSPEYHARTDLTKYHLGLAYAKNVFVDYKGGVLSRPGSQMINHVLSETGNIKLIKFEAEGDDFLLVFSDQAVRFVRSGGYIIESAVDITAITAGYPAEVTTDGAHGYSTGDWVYIDGIVGMTPLNKRYFSIAVTDTDTFELRTMDGIDFDTSGAEAYVSGGSSSRVYTIDSPYLSADLPKLHAEQRYNDLRLTHINYKRQKLTYTSDTNWSITEVTSGSSSSYPTGLSGAASDTGDAATIYAVTAVDAEGNETLPSAYHIMTGIVNFTDTAGSVVLNWDAVAGAQYYYVYRSLVLPSSDGISQAMEVGFIGRAIGPQFVDSNIIADFTKLPPIGTDPFADGSVASITITNAGTGYSSSSTVSVAGGGGSGFLGYPVIDASGTVIGVNIVGGGSGYSSPVVSFSGGSGAAASATLTESTGNNPSTFTILQQRGVYAGTENLPKTIEGSKPKSLDNFDKSTVTNAGDAYSFTLDQQTNSPIKHLVALRSGLLIFTEASIELLRAEEGKAITPLSAIAETQGYVSVSDVRPLKINLDILFTEKTHGNMFAMTFTQYTNSYNLQDMSILASHLFKRDALITSMSYAREPHKLIYCVQSNGSRVLFTYLRDQEVYAWTRDETKGRYLDNVAIEENGRTTIYQVVERTLANGTHKYLERVQPRQFKTRDDYWGVDCGLSYPLTKPEGTCLVSASAKLSEVDVSFSADMSSIISVGDIIYSGGGKIEVTSLTSGMLLQGKVLRAIIDVQKEDDLRPPLIQYSGNWEVGTPTTVVSNLHHLEGETVSVYADGDSYLDKVVVNGQVTLPKPCTKIYIGIPYKCQVKTLSLTSTRALIEGKKKRLIGAAPRLYETLGMTMGPSFDLGDQYTMKDRTDEDWNEELGLRSDRIYSAVTSRWDENGHLYFEQKHPLPMGLLGYVVNADVGDFI